MKLSRETALILPVHFQNMPFFESEENEVYESPQFPSDLADLGGGDMDVLTRYVMLLLSSHELLRRLNSMRVVRLSFDQQADGGSRGILYLWISGTGEMPAEPATETAETQPMEQEQPADVSLLSSSDEDEAVWWSDVDL